MVRRTSTRSLIILASLLAACGGQSTSKQPKRNPPVETKTPASNSDAKTPTPQLPTTTTGSADVSGKYDFVIAIAIGDENKDQANSMKSALDALLSSLGKKFQSQDAKFALIANSTAAISGVGLSLNPADGFSTTNSLQLNFEMASKDTFLGALVAGCGATDSDLESSHSPGNIKVCGQMLSVPSHSWTWGVEDLKGRMQSFLRPGAKRNYIIVASNDAAVSSAQQFMDLSTAQNAGVKPKVYAFIPLKSEGICNDKNLPASVLEGATKLSSGKAYSYCQVPNWGTFTNELMQSFN